MTPFQLIANAQFFFAAPFGPNHAVGPVSFLALDHNDVAHRYVFSRSTDGWGEVRPAHVYSASSVTTA